MHYYELMVSVIFRKGQSVLTYSYHKKLSIGQIVNISVGSKKAIGIIIKEVDEPNFETKEINNEIYDKPLPNYYVQTIQWIAEYYLSPIPNVIQTFLPSGINKNRRITKDETIKITDRKRTNFILNNDQMKAIETIDKSNPGTFMIQGITGSGKTEVYIELAKRTISNNKSAIILIPEISLTTQIISEFSKHFKNILVTHSKMTEAKRHKSWITALNNIEPLLIIGPRSALTLPISNIGLIVIDESHETSYKQDQNPKYSALRLASFIGKKTSAKVIYGTATPTIADRYIAEQSNIPILKLNNKARQGVVKPTITLVDLKDKSNFKNHRFLSDKLIQQIKNNIKEKKQTLIFHNRRGSTYITCCMNCNWVSMCSNCMLPLTLHLDSHELRCHLCNSHSPIPLSCPECGNTNIKHKGIGTKLIESELLKLFPLEKIARFDSDNNTSNSLDKLYDDLYNNNISIAIGTQTIAKGLDLPNLRTVAIIQADSGLLLPDYFAKERVFQLLTQVIGRVGRSSEESNIIIQTYLPNNDVIKYSIDQDYDSFYNTTLLERQNGMFPPFVYLLKLTCSYKTEGSAIKNSKLLIAKIRQNNKEKVQIFGPAPSFYENQNGNYRWQITIKSKTRAALVNIANITAESSGNWQIDLDPTSLL